MATRPTKHLRPDSENRAEAVGLIVTGMKETADWFAQSRDMVLQSATQEMDGGASEPLALFSDLTLVFFYGVGHASSRILRGDHEGWDEASEMLAAMYWGTEIGQHAWLAEGIGYDMPTSAAKYLMSFHGLASAATAVDCATWHTPFLHNLIAGGSVEGEIFEPDLVAFYRELTRALLDRRWPAARELPAELGDFRPLMELAGEADRFAMALIAYCDFRLSRAFQFKDTQARKPRRPSDTMFVFESQWLALFPFELFSLQAVYRAVTGKALSLAASHPLLQTPLMAVPVSTPLADTTLTRDLQAYGRRCFGDRWQPLTPVPRLRS